jgi:hypothetical protein
MPSAIEGVKLLLRVAELDTAFRIDYLRRAENRLAADLPPADYRRLAALRRHEEETARSAQRAAEAGQWERVEELAAQARAAGAELVRRDEILRLGDAVYQTAPMTLSPLAAALQGLTTHPIEELERLRQEVVEALLRLVEIDPSGRDLYEARRLHFAALAIRPEREEGTSDGTDLRATLHTALRGHDWRRAEQLAHVLATRAQHGRVLTRFLDPARLPDVNQPWPHTAVKGAAHLGLAPALLQELPPLTRYLCGDCINRVEPPAAPLSREQPAPTPPTCGHPVEPEIEPALREALDLLMLHPFVNSLGVRYLPSPNPETLLVETVSESDLDAPSSLLELLHLPGRRGHTRTEIDYAIREAGEQVLEELRLDPNQFALVCIPFDAYLRLAPKQGWGHLPIWTHFDGYQVTRDLHLRPLVGGDVRYGGATDLCSIGRDYTDEHVVTRLAVVRRERLLLPIASERG